MAAAIIGISAGRKPPRMLFRRRHAVKLLRPVPRRRLLLREVGTGTRTRYTTRLLLAMAANKENKHGDECYS